MSLVHCDNLQQINLKLVGHCTTSSFFAPMFTPTDLVVYIFGIVVLRRKRKVRRICFGFVPDDTIEPSGIHRISVTSGTILKSGQYFLV